MSDVEKAVEEFLNFCENADSDAVVTTEKGLPSREALREFLKEHEEHISPTAYQMKAAGNTMVFIFYDQEAYGDRTYFYCVEDGKVYSDYFSIGD